MNTNKKKDAPLLQEQEGAAMVLVLCLMALFFVLSLTTLFSSSVLVGEARDDREAKQCRLLATSFSRQVDEQMTMTYTDSMPDDGSLQYLVRCSIDHMVPLDKGGAPNRWPYYWKKKKITEVSPDSSIVREGTMEDAVHTWLPESSLPEGYSLEMKAYWTFEDYSEFYSNVKGAGVSPYDGILLVVDVVCSGKNRSYTVESCYSLTVNTIESVDGTSSKKNYDDYKWVWTKVWREVV